jgi:hypothetical protein
MSRPDDQIPYLVIEWIGGNCPVQAEGFVCNKPFYFRSRGKSWRIEIGRNPYNIPDYSYSEDYGEWPDAGFMSEEEAIFFIRREATKFKQLMKKSKVGGR